MLRVAILLGALLFGAAPLQAHPNLASSQPAAGASVSAPLTELLLVFTERIEVRYTTITLVSAAGDTIQATVALNGEDGLSVRVRLDRAIGPGSYRVIWRTAGGDGHVVGGEFGFDVAGVTSSTEDEAAGLPSRDSALAAHHVAASESTADVNLSPMAVLIRWGSLTLILLLGGAVLFDFVVRDAAGTTVLHVITRPAARLLSIVIAAGLVLFGVARLAMQSAALHGPSLTWDLTLLATLLARTSWGHGWTLQMAGVLTLLAAFALEPRYGASRRAWVVGLVMLAAGIPLTGHATTSLLAYTSDAAHVLAAAAWIGTLAFILLVAVPFALRRNEHAALATVVRRFSALALIAAPLVVLSGGVSALTHMGRLDDLWLTDYGRLLLVKVALVGLTGATGVYNWRRVQPRLGEGTGTFRLRRSAAVELGIALIVLAVTAVLVATSPPIP